MSRMLRVALVLLVGLAVFPAVAAAQSAITGVVKDTSGAVLPGVTVEAASDALIERVRTATTDDQGLYRLVDLRPGTYTITFTLPGFNNFVRDGLQLASEFTATVNAELKVGTLEETITVTGAAPVVDVTSAARAQILDREAIDAIPTGRSIQGMAQLVPGVSLNLPDTGGARAMQQTYMTVRGMSTANTTMLVDGMLVNGLQSDGAVQSYFNDAMNSEVSIQVSGISADTSAGGVRMNMIPREGGNRFSGDYKVSYRPGNWQSSNLTDRHIGRGLRVGNATDRIFDATLAFGGPIKKNKLWFFTSGRYITVNNFIANTFQDDGSKGIDDQFIKSGMARLTWQVSNNSKLSAYFDEVDKYRGHDMQSNEDPEEAALRWFSPAYHTGAIKYTSTLTNALLLEGGYSRNLEYYTNSYQEGIEQPRGTAAWFAGASRLESDLGGRRAAATAQNTQSPERHALQASLSYLWGNHSLKGGVQMTWGDFWHTVDANADLTQQYRSNATGVRFSVPDSVVIRNTPLKYGERLNRDLGFYLQDSWRLNRLTVNAGIRWEQIKAQVLAAESPAGRFVPARKFEAIQNLPNWTDWAPRFSAIFDVFGTGKTAVKYSLNRYNQIRTTGIAGNYNPLLSQTFTLPWRDANGNDIAEGERGCTGYPRVGCEIDFTALPPNFGIAALNEYGNYPRTWNFENALEVQHELLPGFSVSAAVYRGDFRNLTASINQAWTAADYTPYTFYNPVSGAPFEVFARSLAAQLRPVRNLDTFDPNRRRQYQALMTNLTWRIPGGGQMFGGFTMERERERACTSPDDPNNFVPGSTTTYSTTGLCDEFKIDIPWRKQFKLSGTRQVGWGFELSMAFQSNQSPTSSRVMNVTRGVTRYPANCPAPCPAGQVIMPTGTFGQGSVIVYIEPARATFVERINQLDLKLQRRFQVGRVTLLPVIEVFNLNNSDAIISYVTTNALSNSYLAPNSIMQGRMWGVGLTTRW